MLNRSIPNLCFPRCKYFVLVSFVCFSSCSVLNKTIQQKENVVGKTEVYNLEAVPDTSLKTVNILDEIKIDSTSKELSREDQLLIMSCNNYLELFPNNSKTADVFQIKASTYYNAGSYVVARGVYEELLKKFPKSYHIIEAIKMIAQSYYETKEFEEAEKWYRKLKMVASDSGGQNEVVARISESIFRQAERLEKAGKLAEAATVYERVAIEFPTSKVAEVSLLNAGLVDEKIMEWSSAIQIYGRHMSVFPNSKYNPKVLFRLAKCNEKINHWEKAANIYVNMVKKHTKDPLAVSAMYNAGFCFENAEKWLIAAKTFEKTAKIFPKSKDAANVLFRAAELYMKIGNWKDVERINKIFEKYFKNNEDRVVQSLCMAGIAAQMQGKKKESIAKLGKAVSVYKKLKKKSSINKYYAAKAQFTIGEIYHKKMEDIKLVQPHKVYKIRLKTKVNYLRLAVKSYSKATAYNVEEWTTQSLYKRGLAFEDFAKGLFLQERPKNLSIANMLALETGIAKAVVEYLVYKALPSHEANVRLGQKLKIEDRWILKSREKLTKLPYLAAVGYKKLMTAINKTKKENFAGKSPIAQIQEKLIVLQRLAPLQDEAIELYLKSIEMGVMYKVSDDYTKKSTKEVTSISYTIGETYRKIVDIAKSAPLPTGLSPYEKFLYKIKLVQGGITDHENKALKSFYKNVQIAKAYNLDDKYVDSSKVRLAQMLFYKARSYDVLAMTALENPPFPAGSSEEEKEVYRAQFEELGFKLIDDAVEIYKGILEKYEKSEVEGEWVTHSYVRLYQIDPKEYGTPVNEKIERIVKTGRRWKYTVVLPSDSTWKDMKYDDKLWKTVRKGALPKVSVGDKLPVPIWGALSNFEYQTVSGIRMNYTPAEKIWFRYKFKATNLPYDGVVKVMGIGKFKLYINKREIVFDSTADFDSWKELKEKDVTKALRKGTNIIAIKAYNNNKIGYGISLKLKFGDTIEKYICIPPNRKKLMSSSDVKQYKFPDVGNFIYVPITDTK